MPTIHTEETLRTLYAEPSERALRKQLERLDAHCRRFIALSPFLVMASADSAGRLDASPRGGEPGFVKVLDDQTLLIPDSKGSGVLPSMNQMLKDQIGQEGEPESEAAMRARYQNDL